MCEIACGQHSMAWAANGEPTRSTEGSEVVRELCFDPTDLRAALRPFQTVARGSRCPESCRSHHGNHSNRTVTTASDRRNALAERIQFEQCPAEVGTRHGIVWTIQEPKESE